jgi:CHRD domain
MKRVAAIGIALTLAACGGDSPTTPSNNTGPIVFTAQLSAGNEVPPVTNADANARGTATITFNVTRDPATGAVTGGGSINFSVQLSGFPAGTAVRLAHIHPGAAGINGSPVVDTGLSAATAITLDANGAGTLTFNNVAVNQTDATSIVANPAGFYFNAHTALNPGGAVRGQLVKQ